MFWSFPVNASSVIWWCPCRTFMAPNVLELIAKAGLRSPWGSPKGQSSTSHRASARFPAAARQHLGSTAAMFRDQTGQWELMSSPIWLQLSYRNKLPICELIGSQNDWLQQYWFWSLMVLACAGCMLLLQVMVKQQSHRAGPMGTNGDQWGPIEGLL